MIVEGQITIARTPQQIFDVLADPSVWFELDSALVDIQPRETLVLGASGTMRRRAGMGLTATTAWKVTALEPFSRIEMLITGFGYTLRETISLSAGASGTEVTVVDTLVPTSLIGRAMVGMSRGIIRRDLEARFETLTTYLEAGTDRAG